MKIEKYINEVILAVILLVAAILRFYNYSNLSITNDELDVLLRLRFSTLKEVIDIGVRPDGHPAGVQIFMYYWTNLFGITEASMRFPFVIAGIIVVLFSYLVPAYYFNKTAGLYSAATMCFLQFPLIYSQIARPYCPGLMFTLMSAWFWYLVLFRPNTRLGLKVAGYTISTTLAIYMHYFSFFQVMIIGLTGFAFINKSNYKGYLLSALFIFMLFLPHFNISLDHVKLGGLKELGWLGTPDQGENWFLKYLFFTFNYSYALIGLLGIIFLTSLYHIRQNFIITKHHLVFLLWFIVPFLVGYGYSACVNPVLQRAVLLFSFPFFVFLIFSFVRDIDRPSVKTITTIGLLVFGVINTVVGQSFYQSNFFGVLKEIAQKSIHVIEKYGAQNVTKTINTSLPYSIHYYLDRYNKQIEYTPYEDEDHGLTYENHGRQDLMKMIDIVEDANTDYFLYTWSSGFSPHEMPEIILDKYPCIVERVYYFNSEFYLFGKEETEACVKNDPVFLSMNDFEKENDDWANSIIGRREHLGYDSTFGYQFTQEIEFGPTLQMKVKDLFNATDNIIHTSLWVLAEDTELEANMVITLEYDGTVYEWRGMNLSYFIKNAGQWAKCYHSWRFYEIRSKEDIIKIYVWNNNRNTFIIDNFQVKTEEGNPILYGKVNHSL